MILQQQVYFPKSPALHLRPWTHLLTRLTSLILSCILSYLHSTLMLHLDDWQVCHRATFVLLVYQCDPLALVRCKQMSEKDRGQNAQCAIRDWPQLSGAHIMATFTLFAWRPWPTPVHYFLMSNHHLTGAEERHERQLITHGKSVGL